MGHGPLLTRLGLVALLLLPRGAAAQSMEALQRSVCESLVSEGPCFRATLGPGLALQSRTDPRMVATLELRSTLALGALELGVLGEVGSALGAPGSLGTGSVLLRLPLHQGDSRRLLVEMSGGFSHTSAQRSLGALFGAGLGYEYGLSRHWALLATASLRAERHTRWTLRTPVHLSLQLQW